ncbi:hypothetical protein SCUCBS95973_007875 [Sporothrix curviconia]|uniref:Zn(2)-C6 fungal-type domain-containing protein n=1 Tax=Sporothrix curviconia TaxID=1260050 RepID=A0ABP0CHM8_9PEZI
MVNRGGRSRGCRTCRLRRVKCDERQPHCQRCHKAGLPCSGYTQHGQFVDETARFRVRTPPPAREERENRQLATAPTAPTALTAPTAPARIPPTLQPDDDFVVHTHLVSRLLPGVSGPAAPDILSAMGNIVRTPQPIHKDAIHALAAVYFGKVHRDTRIFDTGVRAYVRALQQLRTALASPAAVLETEETLVSVLCLGLYENVALSNMTGWLNHYEGISHLIETRGPSRHRSGFALELFRHCRFAIIISALVRRRPCYLTKPEWRALATRSPAATATTPASRFVAHDEDLTALFAKVPGLLRDVARMRQALDASASPAAALGLRTRVCQVLSDLHAWRKPFQKTDTASHEDEPLLALHSAVLLCLAPVCDALGIPLAETGGQPAASSSARVALAADICRIAKASFAGSPSSTRAFLFIFPLHVAARNLPPDSSEAVWVNAAMQHVLAETHAFEIGRPRNWQLGAPAATTSIGT